MSKMKVTFTPYVRNEHSMVVVVDNLERVPTQQSMVRAFFQSLAGLSDDVVNDDEEMPEEISDIINKELAAMQSEKFQDEHQETPKEETDKKEVQVLEEVAEETEDEEIKNPATFKRVAKQFLNGEYEGEKKEAVKTAIFSFLKSEFGKVSDIEAYAADRTEQEVNDFFETYSIAVGGKTKKIAMNNGAYSSWEKFLEKGTLEEKKAIMARVMNVYK